MDEKICSKCSINQPISNFEYRKDNDKYRNACRTCTKAMNKEYRKTFVPGANARKEELKKKPQRTCLTCNIEKDVEEFAMRSDTNERRNQCILCRNAYVAEFKRAPEAKVQIAKNLKERRETDENYKLRNYLRTRVKHLATHPEINSIKMIEMTGCSIQEFRSHISKQFKKGMSWDIPDSFQLDHIIPCAHFDLSKEEDKKRCFHYTNYQPLTPEENTKKGAKILDEHMHKLTINKVPS